MCINIPPEFVLVTTVSILTTGGIITENEAFKGFSESSIILFSLMYVVSALIRETKILDNVFIQYMGNSHNVKLGILKIGIFCIIVSSFLFNAAVVGILMPLIEVWTDNMEINRKKMLMPLSFLSIVGGSCSMIGSSTNIIGSQAAD